MLLFYEFVKISIEPNQRKTMEKIIPSPKDGYYVHIGTTNYSFIQTALELQEKGVDNYTFMLALYDPGLADLDIHDPSKRLTKEEKTRILIELTSNPWYFWREFLLVPVPGGKERFKLHLGNCAILWAMSCNLNIYTILPRQNYKTYSILSFYLWAYCFATRNTNIMLFNKQHADSKNNLKRLKEMMEMFPKWILNEVLIAKGDLYQQEYIYSKGRNNRIDAKPSPTNIKMADQLGRGATTPLRYFDELAFIRFIKEVWSSATPAGKTADEYAKQNNTPYGTAISTTTNILSEPSGDFAFNLMNGACRFEERFYDFGEEKTREYMAEARYDFLYSEYQWYELRRDQEWYDDQERSLLFDALSIKKNITLEWPLSSASSIFTEEEMENLKSHQKEITYSIPVKSDKVVLSPSLEFHLTSVVDRSIPFALGVDPSSMIGEDYLAFVLTDPNTEEALGYLRTNKADDTQAKEIFRILMEEIFPNTIAVVETNHYLGTVLVNSTIKSKLYPRIFYRMKLRKEISDDNRKTKKKMKVYGYNTTATSREAAFQYLNNIIQDTPEKAAPPILQSEIESLHRTRTGKIESRPGTHDDILMAYLLTLLAIRDPDKTFRRIYSRIQSRLSNEYKRITAIPSVVFPEGETEIDVEKANIQNVEVFSMEEETAKEIQREMRGKDNRSIIKEIMRMNYNK